MAGGQRSASTARGMRVRISARWAASHWPTPPALRRARLRRAGATALMALAVPLALELGHRPSTPTHAVLVARRDLAAGDALGPGQVRVEALPADAVPSGALRPGDRVAGLVPAAPISAGEPLTGASFVGPALLSALGGRGLLAVPVRFADAAATRLLRPGERLDVFAVPDDGWSGGDGTAGPSGASADDAAAAVAASALSPPPGTGGDAPPPIGGAPSSGSAPSLGVPGDAVPGATAGLPGVSPAGGPGPPASAAPAAPRPIVGGILVLAVPTSADGGDSTSEAAADAPGGLVVLAAHPPDAARLAVAQAHGTLAFAMLP